MRKKDITQSWNDLLRGRIHEDFGDGLARERPVKCRGLWHDIATRAPKCVGTVIVRRDEAILGYPMDRFQLLRGDECLRTRKQTHQLRVHVPPKPPKTQTTIRTSDTISQLVLNPTVPFDSILINYHFSRSHSFMIKRWKLIKLRLIIFSIYFST